MHVYTSGGTCHTDNKFQPWGNAQYLITLPFNFTRFLKIKIFLTAVAKSVQSCPSSGGDNNQRDSKHSSLRSLACESAVENHLASFGNHEQISVGVVVQNLSNLNICTGFHNREFFDSNLQ